MNLFYSNFNKSDSDIILDEIDSKHLSKSLRKKVGDIIRITNTAILTLFFSSRKTILDK